jgi:hypothetical protein
MLIFAKSMIWSRYRPVQIYIGRFTNDIVCKYKCPHKCNKQASTKIKDGKNHSFILMPEPGADPGTIKKDNVEK